MKINSVHMWRNIHLPIKYTKMDVWKYVDRSGGPDACWKWIGGQGGRVTELRPYFGCEGKRYIAYRLVWELLHGRPPAADKMLIHSCDNGRMPIGCCNPRHLSEGTAQNNADDMKARERHGLPHNTVRVIKRLIKEGRKHAEIAELYGVSRELVTAINNERAYGHVKETEE